MQNNLQDRDAVSNWGNGHNSIEIQSNNHLQQNKIYGYSLMKVFHIENKRSLLEKSIGKMVEAAKEYVLENNPEYNPVSYILLTIDS